MEFRLTTEEADVLNDALTSYLRDLRSELVHTDNSRFKEMLKRRRAVLQGIADRIETTGDADLVESFA